MQDGRFLEQIPLFAHLGPEERERLSEVFHERQYKRGSTIFEQGEPGGAAYFVREGRVKVYRLTSEGQEQILGLFGPGQPFGLVVAVDGAPYPASAEAVEDCRVWVVRSEDLRRMMVGHPGLIGGVMQEMGGRLRRAQVRVESLARRSVQQRLAEYVLELVEQADQGAVRAASDPAGSLLIRMTMTHQELGAYLGASRESVTRALADLRRDGAVLAGPGDALTVDRERLKRWVGE